jgi:hypothetical protein
MNFRELIALFGHELRTPLAAIIGYQELLSDGIYGDLTARQREPMARIQRSADMILGLLDGLQALAAAEHIGDDEDVDTDTATVALTLADRLQPLAALRNIRLDPPGRTAAPLPQFPLLRFLRAAEIAACAAIKSSQGCTIVLDCQLHDRQLLCTLKGSALDPARDLPASFDLDRPESYPLNAAQLRLAMAAALLASSGGSLQLRAEQGTVLQMCVPCPGAIDATHSRG